MKVKVTKKIERTYSIEQIRKLCYNDDIEVIILYYRNKVAGLLANEGTNSPQAFKDHNDLVVELLKALRYIDTNNLTYKIGHFADAKGAEKVKENKVVIQKQYCKS